jgi:hypothetical protein
VDSAHLANDLNEFVFRFNRRRFRSREMTFYRVLELAVAHEPVRCKALQLRATVGAANVSFWLTSDLYRRANRNQEASLAERR